MISRCLRELEFISHGINMLNYFIGAEIAKKESSWLALGVIAHKVEA
jgi:hypothetical protein